MIAKITYNNSTYTIDLSKPLDISISLRGNASNVNAWYVGPPKIEPHMEGDFIGSVKEGATTNFNDIHFNPHAHGTHTECLGHITEALQSVNQTLDQFFFLAEVITLVPEKFGKDFVLTKKQLQRALGNSEPEALVIRTLPNTKEKLSRNYSNTNPPYFQEDGVLFLVDKNINHLLVDLPSVDKEKDNGALKAHKAFWGIEGSVRSKATITEFVYVDHAIKDGSYFLNLQVAPFENDASPSRPVLFSIV